MNSDHVQGKSLIFRYFISKSTILMIGSDYGALSNSDLSGSVVLPTRNIIIIHKIIVP